MTQTIIICLGVALTGGRETTGRIDITLNNRINDYSPVSPTKNGLLFRCITGLGPGGNTNDELGGLYFKGRQIPNEQCEGPGIKPIGATIFNFVGAINTLLCTADFNINLEGVYTCMMRNSSLLYENIRIGVYFTTRSK